MKATLTYNEQETKEIYQAKYSGFQFLPGYAAQKKYVLACMKGLAKTFGIQWNKFRTYLDLGCGIGTKTYALSHQFSHAVGIDFVDRAIKVATLLNDNPNLSFNIKSTLEESEMKFDFATAFGLSVFNQSDVKRCAEEIIRHIHLHLNPKGNMIIGSFTDFSGLAPTGWYMHTKRELSELKRQIESAGFECTYYFPHRHFTFYFSNGAEHLGKEVFKWMFRKRRDYFIVLQKSVSHV